MNLGKPELSLNVRDLSASLAFYQSLGFNIARGDQSAGWLVVERDGLHIGLYQGHIDCNLLTFNGGDVEAVARELAAKGVTLASGPEKESDGTVGAMLWDPDGNLIYLNS